MFTSRTIDLRVSSALLTAFGLLWYVCLILALSGYNYGDLNLWISVVVFFAPVLMPILAAMLLYGYYSSGRKHAVWVWFSVFVASSVVILMAVQVVLASIRS
jgi:hypothetical protein